MGLQRYCYVCLTADHYTNTPECPKNASKLIAAQAKPVVAPPKKVVEQAKPIPKVVEQPTIVVEQSVVEPVVEQPKVVVARYGRQKRWYKRNADKMRAYHRQYMRERRAANRPENFIIAKAK